MMWVCENGVFVCETVRDDTYPLAVSLVKMQKVNLQNILLMGYKIQSRVITSLAQETPQKRSRESHST